MKLFIALPIVILLSVAQLSYAHMGLASVDEVMERMMIEQKVDNVKQLDCKNVSENEFEELGDVVMERVAGNHELHEQMDLMMGGEGSESLRQMHIAMGKNWLNCDGRGMMGYGMMPMMMRMMGNYYPAYYNNYDAIVIIAIMGWVLFGGAILYLALTKFTIKKKKR